jgi:hypothetical protein
MVINDVAVIITIVVNFPQPMVLGYPSTRIVVS